MNKSALQFALPAAEIKPALAGLGKVIAKRCTLPVLGHIKIERTRDGWVALTGTDLDSFVTVRLEQPAAGEPGAILVPYAELLKTIKSCDRADEILVEHNGEATATIKYRVGQQFVESKVESLPVEEFPEIPKIKGEPIPLPDTLRQSIHDALECASTDETRLILNGAFLDASKPEAHYVVATDGRHLFSSNSFSLPLTESLMIPSHRFLDWKQFSADGEWQIKVNASEDKDSRPRFQISSRRWRFIGRQIEGNYPNWRQVVPDSSGTHTTIELDPVVAEEIVKTISRLPNHDEVNHTLGLEIANNALTFLCRASRTDSWTRVSATGIQPSGTDVRIFLNRHLLAKALRFGLGRVEIIDALSPMKLSHEGRQMVIQPVRPEVDQSPAPSAEESVAPVAESNNSESNEPEPNPAAIPGPTEDSLPPQTAKPAESGPSAIEKTAIETAVAQVDILRSDLRGAIADLNILADALKSAQREQKANDKEIQSVRQTIRSLQSVRI